MESTNPYYDSIHGDPKYKDVPANEMPFCESLELTIKRLLPFWEEQIVPAIKSGKAVIVAAHGNSLRRVVKHLEGW